MHTQGLYGWRVDGRDLLQHSALDSDPRRLGRAVADTALAALAEKGAEGLREDVRRIRLVDRAEAPTHDDIRAVRAWTAQRGVDMPKSHQTYEALLGPLCGHLDACLALGLMPDGRDLAANGYLSEWAYCVNLDDASLEVYSGQHRTTHADGRFAALERDSAILYAPIRLLAALPLDALPAAWWETVDDLDTLLKDAVAGTTLSGHSRAAALTLHERYGPHSARPNAIPQNPA